MTFPFPSEADRLAAFPIAKSKIFLGHAAVTCFPACVSEAMADYARACCDDHQEFGDFLGMLKQTRQLCGDLIGAHGSEVALLGPTSLGLSLIANGIDWQPGDEILCYRDDYPANVYPWLAQERHGAVVKYIDAPQPGVITPELVEASLTPKTKLVALASCHFLTGYRIDIATIGKMLRDRGVLFSLDAIQTCGAFDTPVEHVDFMSADAHKWLLGPTAIGIVYVKKENFEKLRPTLLGAWNVDSPDFVTQDEIRFLPTAQRYEPGVLNTAGIVGLQAVLEMLLGIGIENVSARLLELKTHLLKGLDALGCQIHGPRDGANASGITTFLPPDDKAQQHFLALETAGIIASCRKDRAGREYLRFSPHFYNTESELDRALEVLSTSITDDA